MSWHITVNAYGQHDETTVDGKDITDAVVNGLTELGYDENDEGSLTITISGEAS